MTEEQRIERLRKLPKRMREISHLVGNGESNERIGEILGLELKTVKNTLTSIFSRLDLYHDPLKRGSQREALGELVRKVLGLKEQGR